jgi:glycerol dehydrogenase
MARILISPVKYIQGEGELNRIKDHISHLGNAFFFIAGSNAMASAKGTIEESFKDSGAKLVFEKFNGECSNTEISRLKEIFQANNCDVVVGLGGGKAIDTAKAIVYYVKSPLVIVPTIASTDAPTSSLSVIYTDKGVFDWWVALPRNPEIVLVDTGIIVSAPIRFLVAGMGDALGTYFEAMACAKSDTTNFAGGKSTKAALALAKLCYDILIQDGVKAKMAAEKKVVTNAVENVVEANIYLSGVGFESNGCACAHSIYNGFTVLDDHHKNWHGEYVAFGTLVQLILENSPTKQLEEVMKFCIDVGLPVTLGDLSYDTLSSKDLMRVAEAACAEGQFIHNEPFAVNQNMTYAAIVAADALGRKYKANPI